MCCVHNISPPRVTLTSSSHPIPPIKAGSVSFSSTCPACYSIWLFVPISLPVFGFSCCCRIFLNIFVLGPWLVYLLSLCITNKLGLEPWETLSQCLIDFSLSSCYQSAQLMSVVSMLLFLIVIPVDPGLVYQYWLCQCFKDFSDTSKSCD